LEAQSRNELVFTERKGKWSVNYKQYLNGVDGTKRKSCVRQVKMLAKGPQKG
jgi:hypothetical protein